MTYIYILCIKLTLYYGIFHTIYHAHACLYILIVALHEWKIAIETLVESSI